MSPSHAFGKVILFGEHAVVYGRPAIAAPVTDVCVTVEVENTPPGRGIVIHATDIGQTLHLHHAPADEPLSLTVRNTLAHLGIDAPRSLQLTIHSTIPVASGLGSGAAVATAIVRALSAHLKQPLDAAAVSSLVYQTEKLFHGTPSGIDNTVIAFEQPVYFQPGRPLETIAVPAPFWLAIADTGHPSLTKASVADVRAAWQDNPEKYNKIFDQIGRIVEQTRQAIETGRVAALGPLMRQNQQLLRQLDVSSAPLERLIDAALAAGAPGAKLCGGGRGGIMIALLTPECVQDVQNALRRAGARRVITTQVGK